MSSSWRIAFEHQVARGGGLLHHKPAPMDRPAPGRSAPGPERSVGKAADEEVPCFEVKSRGHGTIQPFTDMVLDGMPLATTVISAGPSGRLAGTLKFVFWMVTPVATAIVLWSKVRQ